VAIDPPAADPRPPVVIYLGPGLGGKTANLLALAGGDPAALTVYPVPGVPGAAWEFLPLDYGPPAATRRLHLLAAPGRLRCSEVRRRLLRGADGAVFVADARAERQEANLVLLDELGRHLLDLGWQPARFPIALQLNRLDDPTALPVVELRRRLDPPHVPVVPARADRGEGVTESLDALLERLPPR